MMETEEIVHTIKRQLVGTIGINEYWAWGVSKEMSLDTKMIKMVGLGFGLGAFLIEVNARYYTGKVIIVLNGVDTYDVYLVSVNDEGKFDITEEMKGLYFDTMGDAIGSRIELKGKQK